MKHHNFVKYHPRINKITGCQRSTLILSTLEYWFQKKPEGFYKFIEPCSHRLYREGDSWTEELDCDRKSFAASFDKIAVRYKSRGAFNDAEDKFQNRMYASYYDRNTNQTYFIRNHDLANEVLSGIISTRGKESKKEVDNTLNPSVSLSSEPLRNGKNSRSYKESKSTSNNLSKDKSHAEEIIKKMIEIWTALVEEGKELVKLSKTTIPFLKKAFTDKFDNCLEKWKKYCQDIASSRFLMGEIKSSFRATLDWALKFDIIQKILGGNYGIGDRRPSTLPSAAESFVKNSKIEMASEEAVIEKSADEPELVREFRLKWLNKFGANNYREYLKDCAIDVEGDATLNLRPSSRYRAKSIVSYWTPTLFVGSPFTKVHIIQQEGDLFFDKWFGLEPIREGRVPHNDVVEVNVSADLTGEQIVRSLPESTNIIEDVNEKSLEKVRACEAEESRAVVVQVTSETQMLRKKLRESMPNNHFPTWLGGIEVEEVGRDGAVIVTFEDSFAVGWSRSRFSKEIFQSAANLWKGVNKLIIRQKEGNTVPLPIEKLPKKSENVVEKTTLEQAIKSFLSVCSPGMKASEKFGMQGAC